MTGRSTQSVKKFKPASQWIALEGDRIIAKGVDLAEVYVNAMTRAKSRPQFKRIANDARS